MKVIWLGRVGYLEGLTLQIEHRDAVLLGGEDRLLLLEHDPVVTLGRRGGVVDRSRLKALSTPVIETDRGGLATWHGPGQLVGYPITHLQRARLAVPQFVSEIGRWLCDVTASVGLDGVTYDACRPGVYREGRKLGSIGLHIHKQVSTHGFALNVHNSLDGFHAIEPCGASDLTVSTLAEELQRHISLEVVREALLDAVEAQPRRRTSSTCEPPQRPETS